MRLEGVKKQYKMDHVVVHALEDVSLSIRRGEFLAIIGPSGSGKSTLLHMMGLLDRPTRGRLALEGKDVSKLSDAELAKVRGEKIGFVFQFFNLYPTLTAAENVELPMLIAGKEKNERRSRALKLLKEVGMAQRANHYPAQLSGGERQRVAIARALSNEPSLILADEPTGNLDSKTGMDILHLFTRLNKAGTTIVLVTHEKHIAVHTKRIISIRDGHIQGDKRNAKH